MTDEWMRCPKCGSDGMNAGHYDWIFKAQIMEFRCDSDDIHHFLIVELPPTEVTCEDNGTDQCDPAICDVWRDCNLRLKGEKE